LNNFVYLYITLKNYSMASKKPLKSKNMNNSNELPLNQAYGNYVSNYPNKISKNPEISITEFEIRCEEDNVFWVKWRLKK